MDAGNDPDGDVVCALSDNCPLVTNADQSDLDFDGLGDACDSCLDSDADGAGNPGTPTNTCPDDNCPLLANVDQLEDDLDLLGNACDNCPFVANSGQANADFDVAGDACDNCPLIPSAVQDDADLDQAGDACDNCPGKANTDQLDADSDLAGDACDGCPLVFELVQQDSDADAVGDACDNCVDVANPTQDDANTDGIGDACDISSLVLSWANDTKLTWSGVGSALSYAVYRGTVPERSGMSSRGFGVASYDHSCLAGNLAPDPPSRAIQDTDPVPPGARAFYYLVSATRAAGESSLGEASDDLDLVAAGDQLERPNLSPCP